MTEEDFHALGTLATNRVQDACNSVGQMLDSGEQALDMLLREGRGVVLEHGAASASFLKCTFAY
jgi:hypothetical protein